MTRERLSIPCVSCWPPLHLPWTAAHRGFITDCAGPSQGSISIHHKLPRQPGCFTFGCCTGALLMLGWLFSWMECPHGPGSRWRQFHGQSLAGQEPCLGSLLLPRMTSLQTGVASSSSDFLGASCPGQMQRWHRRRNTKHTLSVSFLKAHFSYNAFSRADNYICHPNSFILFMSLQK